MSRTGPRAKKLNRRQILKTNRGRGGCVLPGADDHSGQRLWGATGRPPPASGSCMGAIGLGSRGEFDLKWMLREKDVQFVAICDARKVRREAIKQIIDKHYGNSDCQMYPEMREFLATRDDIDAVLIATGDRWHSLAACMAMRSGKDVYSEKPSCMTIAEGRMVVDTARRYGRIYQTGVQRLSEGPFVTAIELARSGRLGQIKAVQAHIAPWDAAEMSHAWLPEEPQPSKEEVDWDAWLGPCPWRPYNSTYVRGGWRGHYDFHTSCIGEWGAHTFAQSQAGIGALDDLGRRISVREELQRRRHGHQVRQRNSDDPLPRRQVLAWIVRNAVRRHRRLGRVRRWLQGTRDVLPCPARRRRQAAGRLHGPHPAADEPRAQLLRLRQVARDRPSPAPTSCTTP